MTSDQTLTGFNSEEDGQSSDSVKARQYFHSHMIAISHAYIENTRIIREIIRRQKPLSAKRKTVRIFYAKDF